MDWGMGGYGVYVYAAWGLGLLLLGIRTYTDYRALKQMQQGPYDQ